MMATTETAIVSMVFGERSDSIHFQELGSVASLIPKPATRVSRNHREFHEAAAHSDHHKTASRPMPISNRPPVKGAFSGEGGASGSTGSGGD